MRFASGSRPSPNHLVPAVGELRPSPRFTTCGVRISSVLKAPLPGSVRSSPNGSSHLVSALANQSHRETPLA
jgi:hypothetical protein